MGSTTLSKQIVNGMRLKTNDSSIVKIMKPMALINDNLDELVKMPGRLEQFRDQISPKNSSLPTPFCSLLFWGVLPTTRHVVHPLSFCSDIQGRQYRFQSSWRFFQSFQNLYCYFNIHVCPSLRLVPVSFIHTSVFLHINSF